MVLKRFVTLVCRGGSGNPGMWLRNGRFGLGCFDVWGMWVAFFCVCGWCVLCVEVGKMFKECVGMDALSVLELPPQCVLWWLWVVYNCPDVPWEVCAGSCPPHLRLCPRSCSLICTLTIAMSTSTHLQHLYSPPPAIPPIPHHLQNPHSQTPTTSPSTFPPTSTYLYLGKPRLNPTHRPLGEAKGTSRRHHDFYLGLDREVINLLLEHDDVNLVLGPRRR